MIRRMLIIGYKQPLAQELKRKWVSEGLCPYYAENLKKVAEELDGSQDYSLVLILDDVNVMEAVRTVRRISKIPILVVRKRYDGVEKIAVLETGADEYMQYPERIEEGIASVRALIRRYTEWNPCYGYIGCEPSDEGFALCQSIEGYLSTAGKLYFRERNLICYIHLPHRQRGCSHTNSFFT